MTTALTIMSVWVLAASGIQLGTLWIMKLSILPLLNGLPYDRYVSTCQRIDMHVFHPIAVWNGVIAAGIGVIAAVAVPGGGAATLFITGSVGMLIVGLTSEGVNWPIWRQIEKWSIDTVDDEKWAQKRHTWHLAHQVRTYGAIVAVAAYIAAILAI
ncbi:MAG: hypothetical protein LC635_00140 [Pseudonocardiaceae bacterium]|nr:hypothetical protein [Pseudonocardiaceae bacterium]